MTRIVSSTVHEVGHNLGLAHSGDGNLEYGDQSGMMGKNTIGGSLLSWHSYHASTFSPSICPPTSPSYSYNSDDTPLMCFNPAKNYQLGWYR